MLSKVSMTVYASLGVGNGQVADVWLSLKVSLETFGQVFIFFVFISPLFLSEVSWDLLQGPHIFWCTFFVFWEWLCLSVESLTRFSFFFGV